MGACIPINACSTAHTPKLNAFATLSRKELQERNLLLMKWRSMRRCAMRKRTKALTAVGACALCVAMLGGAAYAAVPSYLEAQHEVAVQEAQADERTYDEAFANAYVASAMALELCGRDASGNDIAAETQSPSVTAGTSHQIVSAADQADQSQLPQGATEAAGIPADSLVIFNNVIPYVEAFDAPRAPDSTAGLWKGSDLTTDGGWGYFIGHHPGVFNCVMYLQNGDQIQVVDSNGNARTYTVFAVYDVPDDTQWGEISKEITSHGESITLQTCYGDHETYRIVEAA